MGIARLVSFVLFCTATVWLSFSPASAEKRVALVIGNGAYKNASKLPNPPNDAKIIAGILQSAGFDDVALHENLGIREMRRAINAFADAARDADTAVVYYSGHGMEVNGVNYLVPIDAALERDTDVPYETISLDNLVQVMEPARRLRLIMLDACRDNPFTRSMRRTVGARAIGRGLAAVEPTSVNTLVAYAAKAGSYALDGDGANSPYATALINNLATPGLDLRIAFGRVRDEVLKVTKNKQEPFLYGSLGGSNVSIVDVPSVSGGGTSQQAQAPVIAIDPAAQAWAAAKDTTNPAVLEAFVRRFGDTFYGDMARARLEELKKTQITAAPTTPSTQPVSPQSPTGDAAERAWATARNSTSISVLEDFIRQHGNSRYGPLARTRLEELKKSQIAVASPSSPTTSDRKNEPNPKKAGCARIVGTWIAPLGNEVVFKANGTFENPGSPIGRTHGTWSCSDGKTFIVIVNGVREVQTLSDDGNTLSGEMRTTGIPIRVESRRKQ